ncbi:PH domain-containing protein [Rubrivirga sp. IMCC45206]|uniref:PH domain-containing protein n=1 Tax=Rubrivirga sp. IMCC45206 TaxID=3391614 RepID=UPI0039903259
MRLRFSAPWSTPLTLISTLMVVIVAGAWFSGATLAVVLLLAVLALAAALSVRGYVVEPDAVVVLRLGWATRLPLEGLESVEAEPEAMRRALRTFGIGGPFAFVGRYRTASLGDFTAYATSRPHAVVLRWPERTVVVTPDDPDTFVAAVEAAVAEA